MLGWVHGDHKLELLRDHAALVLPSWAEGLPNAMIEAMAAGCVVVVSEVGNIPDYVEDGHNGLLHTPRNSTDLARALRQLLAPATDIHLLGQTGHDTAARLFSPQAAAQLLIDIVTDTISPAAAMGRKKEIQTHAD